MELRRSRMPSMRATVSVVIHDGLFRPSVTAARDALNGRVVRRHIRFLLWSAALFSALVSSLMVLTE